MSIKVNVMDEFDEFFDKEFFVFDSNNLDEISERFYGYMVSENGIIQNDNLDSDIDLTGIGAYLWVKVTDDTVRIAQDFNGSWELYVYFSKDNDYFAISNSYIKLLEHIKDNANLTINRDYANSFLFIDLSSYFYEDTLINEIKYVPRNCEVVIDKKNKTIFYDEIDYEENSVDLDSEETLDILDSWFEKWVNILRSVKSKTNNFSVDLTGGLDSRAVAVIWLSANLNFDKLYVRTIVNNKVKKYIRDLKVASELSDYFNFPLNNNTIRTTKEGFNDILTPLLASFYLKLGFHKQMHFPTFRHDQPVYAMDGRGGGTIRGYANKTPKQFIDGKLNFLKDKGEEVCDSTDRILSNSFSKLLEKFPEVDSNSNDLPRLLYNEVRSRHHVGKVYIENYFENVFNLSPLLDPSLRKLKLTTEECDDRDLVLALIFTRFYPRLLDVDFETNKKIDENTLRFAKEISDRRPYIKKQYSFIEGPEIGKFNKNKLIVNGNSISEYLKSIFTSRFFEYEFKKYYPSYFYDVLSNEINNRNVINHVYGSFAILNSINYASDNPLDIKSWLNSFSQEPLIADSADKDSSNEQYLKIYETARIDIVKEGESQNKVEILENSDNLAKISFPKSFQKENSSGFFITSDKGQINLKLKCLGDGKVKIFLKSLGLKDRNNVRFPIYIDYFKLVVNNRNYLEKNRLICHDDRYHITLDVKDSEILDVYVKWLPYNELSEYTDKMKILKDELKSVRIENKKLLNENNKNNI